MKRLLKRLWEDTSGQDLTEYALLLVLVSLGAIGSFPQLADAISDTFDTVAAAFSTKKTCCD